MYYVPYTTSYKLYIVYYIRNYMEMTPTTIGHLLMLLIWNCICIYTNYVYNYARLYTTYMVYHRLPTIYNVLCTLYYVLCIPYHIHYMLHTTHSFLCIIISNINHSINIYYILCTICYVLDSRY